MKNGICLFSKQQCTANSTQRAMIETSILVSDLLIAIKAKRLEIKDVIFEKNEIEAKDSERYKDLDNLQITLKKQLDELIRKKNQISIHGIDGVMDINSANASCDCCTTYDPNNFQTT